MKKYVFEDISSRSIDCNKKDSNHRNIFSKIDIKTFWIFQKILKIHQKISKIGQEGGYIILDFGFQEEKNPKTKIF